MRLILVLALGLGLASPAKALPDLSTNSTVMEGLFAVGLADRIRKKCPDISARLLKAYNYIRSLEAHAKSLGYSDAEIEALIDNKSEEAKLKVRIAAYLAERGATPENANSYCAPGLAEIENKTAAGALLRAN